MMRNRPWKAVLGCTAGYLLLLTALVRVESGAETGVIRTYQDGFWYTLTTLTTVGYGDLYPVTEIGRLIGVVFQLLSLGLLAVLVGACALMFRGTILPWIRLKLHPHDPWYLFGEHTPESDCLASAIEQEEHGVVLFAENRGSSLSTEQILKIRGDHHNTVIFCIGDNDAENLRQAAQYRHTSALVCCESVYEPDLLSEREIIFDPCSLCARLYWQKYPVTDRTETIHLIGSGRYAEALLEYALIQNVIDPDQQITYHVCGDFGSFRRNHPALRDVCMGDRLYFSENAWNEDLTTLSESDRIIFCDESREMNLDRVTQLLRYCAVQGNVYAMTDVPIPGAVSFGTVAEIWTPEHVMRTKLNRTAILLNDIYRKETGGTAPEWRSLSSFTRRSNLASADHLPVKIRILLDDPGITEAGAETYTRAYHALTEADEEKRREYREIEHMRWMRFHLMNGWKYSPVRDNQKRRHPLLVPFNELSAEDQAKDDYGWQLIGTLAEYEEH